MLNNEAVEKPVCYLLTIDQVAELMNVCPRTINRLNAAGKLPKAIKIGRALRWNRVELMTWLNYGGLARAKWQPIWEGLRGASLN